jgi:serine/threonine protein phosphatase PrpC
MGNCCNKQEDLQDQTIEYLKTLTLSILVKNFHGKVDGTDKVVLQNTSPIKIEATSGFIGTKHVKITGCVLPGIDPRGEIEKDCQDDYFFIMNEEFLLCTLFDGHGKEGQEISRFCTSFVSKFYLKNQDELLTSPAETLTRMMHKCDEKLRRGKIKDDMAGTTAVAVLVSQNNVFSASLGDSRAVIATMNDQEIKGPDRTGKYFKKVQNRRHLKPVPLTTDQKPNHEEEFERIQAAGGIVEQVTDHFGKKIGPYRVWLPRKDHPGLAMSRSIGDRIAKRIGVIATPIIHDFPLYQQDLFIVIASDGVWDVMENIEVINFVDSLKKDCSNSSNLYPARPDNSSIARLLCEEARYRWCEVIEKEDVMIDDISCIIIDLEDIHSTFKSKQRERNTKAFQSLAIDSSISDQTTGIQLD